MLVLAVALMVFGLGHAGPVGEQQNHVQTIDALVAQVNQLVALLQNRQNQNQMQPLALSKNTKDVSDLPNSKAQPSAPAPTSAANQQNTLKFSIPSIFYGNQCGCGCNNATNNQQFTGANAKDQEKPAEQPNAGQPVAPIVPQKPAGDAKIKI